jgi:hypothetical protein
VGIPLQTAVVPPDNKDHLTVGFQTNDPVSHMDACLF